MRTVLIDYGAGNLHSVERALQRAGLAVERASHPASAAGAEAMVLPGQGHFGQVMRAFKASGFESPVRAHLAAGRPFLGICVGLQLLLEASEEAPEVPGLGLLRGTARRFPATGVSVPHMGWNQIEPRGRPALLEGVADGAFVYFAHSYYVAFEELDVPGAVTEYGPVRFKSAISQGPLHATQFHPEKSQAVGLRVLENFARLAANALEA
ncbi:MAG TPA: imidazole glycerol phosphate synthase subunit HisH [Trueperaceae bacterium]|nr:imidazole glycerol phosphate synthase subunit HisH [Trueperaceae bacterium]